jgi:hypothetical protein
MNAQKLRGREGRNSAKIFSIVVLFIFLISLPLHADTVWESGHHEINDGDIYGEIWMYNDCTLDIFGGDIYRLTAYDTTITDWYDGVMDDLWVRDYSTVNIYGGVLDTLVATENSVINLFAYDVICHPTGGYYDRGWVEGKYLDNDLYFSYDLIHMDSISHINVVPEPTTLLLVCLGTILLKKGYQS